MTLIWEQTDLTQLVGYSYDDKRTNIDFPQTLQQAIIYFVLSQNALNFMIQVRWPDGKITCPRCKSDPSGS